MFLEMLLTFGVWFITLPIVKVALTLLLLASIVLFLHWIYISTLNIVSKRPKTYYWGAIAIIALVATFETAIKSVIGM